MTTTQFTFYADLVGISSLYAASPAAAYKKLNTYYNDVFYGLASGLWTRDVKKAHRVARALKAGTVWVNMYNFFDPGMPFGGYKGSGFGRDLGAACLNEYTQVKSVWLNLD